MVARLANSLGYELAKAEGQRSAHSTNPDAIDLTMRARALMFQPPDRGHFTEARSFLEQALKLDPQNAEAMVRIALSDALDVAYGWTDRTDESLREALDILAKANAVNPGDAYANYIRSLSLFLARRYPEAVDAAQTAASLNSNLPGAYFAMGQAEFPQGLCEQAIAQIKRAFELSPRDPSIGSWHMNIGNAEFCLGHDDAAIAQYRQAIDAAFRPWVPYAGMAAAYAMKGDDAAAKSALAEAKQRLPQLTVTWILAHAPYIPRFLDGLRKAGLPEE